MRIAYKEYIILRRHFLIVLNSFDIPDEYIAKYIILIEDLDKKIRETREQNAESRVIKIKDSKVAFRPFREHDLKWD